MYVLVFKHENNYYLLHNGDECGFTGSESLEDATLAVGMSLMLSIPGGIQPIEVDEARLSNLIGGVPYYITDFWGGIGLHWYGVIVKNQNFLPIDLSVL